MLGMHFRRYMDSMNMFHFCAIAFVGHVHIERNLFMSLDRTSASCDLCALESIQDLNLKIRQSLEIQQSSI